jgi:hypothetical protein
MSYIKKTIVAIRLEILGSNLGKSHVAEEFLGFTISGTLPSDRLT